MQDHREHGARCCSIRRELRFRRSEEQTVLCGRLHGIVIPVLLRHILKAVVLLYGQGAVSVAAELREETPHDLGGGRQNIMGDVVDIHKLRVDNAILFTCKEVFIQHGTLISQTDAVVQIKFRAPKAAKLRVVGVFKAVDGAKVGQDLCGDLSVAWEDLIKIILTEQHVGRHGVFRGQCIEVREDRLVQADGRDFIGIGAGKIIRQARTLGEAGRIDAGRIDGVTLLKHIQQVCDGICVVFRVVKAVDGDNKEALFCR